MNNDRPKSELDPKMATKSDLNAISENSEDRSDENTEFHDDIVITVDDAIDSCQNKNGGIKNGDVEQNGGVFENGTKPVLKVSNSLLSVPLSKNGHRMSFMEEESAKEKLRLALLKQCAAILKQGDQRYTKESLHRTFQDVVRLYFLFSFLYSVKVSFPFAYFSEGNKYSHKLSYLQYYYYKRS